MIICSQFERVDPKTLHIHPLNESVFGPAETELDQDFLASIQRDGIVTPIAITPDGMVLSGHRRLAAAIRCSAARQIGIQAILRRRHSEAVPRSFPFVTWAAFFSLLRIHKWDCSGLLNI